MTPMQSLIDAFNHEVAVEGLFQKCDGTRSIDLLMNLVIRESRHKDDGDFTSEFQKAGLQFGPRHPWHLHVGDQARCVVKVRRAQKFLGRAKRAREEPTGSEKARGRKTNGFVVIDNADSRILRHEIALSEVSAKATARLPRCRCFDAKNELYTRVSDENLSLRHRAFLPHARGLRLSARPFSA